MNDFADLEIEATEDTGEQMRYVEREG